MREEQLNLFDPGTMNIDQVLDGLSPDLRSDPGSWPATLSELIDVVADHFECRASMDPDMAMAMAQDLIIVISHHLGKRSVYLPGDEKIKRAVRDSSIYRAWKAGTSHLELSRQTGLTPARIYAIIDKQRRIRQDRNQMTLPFPD